MAQNELSSQVVFYPQPFHVQVQISGLELSVSVLDGRRINATATVEEGTAVVYTWEFGDGRVEQNAGAM